MMHRNASGAPPALIGQDLQRFVRLGSVSFDPQTRTAEAVFSTGAPFRRFGLIEELAMEPAAVNLARVEGGRMALLFNHNPDRPIGNVVDARIENGRLAGTLRFAETDDGQAFADQVQRGELASISIGYRVNRWAIRAIENDTEIWRAEEWELFEVSLVTVPADPAAAIRAASPQAAPAADQEPQMEPEDNLPVETPVNASPAPDARAAAETAVRAERARVTALTDIARRGQMPAEALTQAIESGETVESFRGRALDNLAARNPVPGIVSVQRDETETRRAALEEALTRNINAQALPGDFSAPAAQYRGFNLVELAAERLGERRIPSHVAGREDILRRAMHTTPDFPILLENAVNRNLAAAYGLATPTYREIAMREDFNDFRPHTTAQVGDFPLPQPVAESGEIKFGTVGEKKETVTVVPYAVGLSFSRQVMINDNLMAIDRLIRSYALSVALFEDKTAYAVLGLNSGDGPTLLEGSAAMFTIGRTNKAGTNGAISVTTVGAARAAMRGYKTIDGNEMPLNTPAILLVGPAKETEAEQFVTPMAAAASQATINVFAGRIRVLATPFISGNRWYLFANPQIGANFRWGYLNGYEAPRQRIEDPFGVQGTRMSVEHDFGFGGIDWRFGYTNAGA